MGQIENFNNRYSRLRRTNQGTPNIADDVRQNPEDDTRTGTPKQPTGKQSEPDMGDTVMTDKIKDDEVKDKNNPANPKQEKFTLTKAQLWAAEHAPVNVDDYDSVEAVMAAVKERGYVVEGDQVLKLGADGEKTPVAEYDKEKDAVVEKEQTSQPKTAEDEEKTDTPKPLEIDAPNPNQSDHENNPDHTWVQEKVADYKNMSETGKIGNINITKGLNPEDAEFEVEVAGGTIHYSSKDKVTVSDESRVETFEAILQEKHNAGRPINFGENMSHEMSIRLLAACVLHDKEMQGKFPQELNEQDFQLLKTELGEERYIQFYEKLTKPESTQENAGNDKSGEEKEPVSDEAKQLREIRESFEEKKASGLVKVVYDEDSKKHVVVKGDAQPGEDGKPTEEDKQKAVDDVNKMMEKAAELAKAAKAKIPEGKELKAAEKELTAEQIQTRDEINNEKIAMLRARMDEDKLRGHDLDRANKIAMRDQKDEDMAVKLGILKPEIEGDTLSGDELKSYIADNKINQFTYYRLNRKYNEGKEMTDAQKQVYDTLPKAPEMGRGTQRE